MDWLTDNWRTIKEAVLTGEYWLGVVTSFALLFIRHRLKLPNIKVGGGGSGGAKTVGGKSFGFHRFTIVNDPSFFGYPINRDDLSIATSMIYDPKKRSYEGYLLTWEGQPDDKSHLKDIKVGETASVFVCGVSEKRVHHYCGANDENIERSETLVELGDSRELEIHITDKFKRRYKIPFRISAKERRSSAQKLEVRIIVKTTFSDRFLQFRRGIGDMLAAFTRRSY